MNITKVSIKNLESGNLKAMVSITFDDCFVVGGLKIMSGTKGLFVSMPSRKDKDDKWIDTCFPITKEFRQELINTILGQYKSTEADPTAGYYPVVEESDEDPLPF